MGGQGRDPAEPEKYSRGWNEAGSPAFRIFRIWRDRISQDPDTWSHGFNLSLVRVDLRSFLNTYGQQVVAILGAESRIEAQVSPLRCPSTGEL